MEALERLIERAQAADGPPGQRQEAFGELVRRYQDLAYGYAHALLGDPHLAQDAAQEAFLTAYRTLPQLRVPQAFAGWLRCIVRTHCVRLTRGKRLALAPLSEAEAAAPGALGAGSAAGADPTAAAEARELRAALAAAVAALPERERESTILFYVGGYPQQEIAAFLGVPPNTIKKRLQAARQRLYQRLRDQLASYADGGERERMETMVRRTLRRHAPSRDDGFVETVQFLAALDAAATEGELHLLELMVVDGVDLNARDADGQTLLGAAAQRGDLDATAYLLQHGADVNAPDAAGRTPLSRALAASHPRLAALLREHGAST